VHRSGQFSANGGGKAGIGETASEQGIREMASLSGWKITPARQPKHADYDFDLERALASAVSLRTVVPEDAFTAQTLGTERGGSGIVIRDNVVLTIGYLITEAEEIWITLDDDRVLAGHPLAYDQVTGFGLVQALGQLDLPSLPLGDSGAAKPGSRVVMAAAGGREHALATRIVAKQEFAGYWEYLLDEAIFVAPAHPFWGGAGLIDAAGELVGIGSLQVEQRTASGDGGQLNMVVPIDLLKPILDDMLTSGRANRPPKAWLGVFATDLEGKVFVVGVYSDAPADRAGLKPGDLIVSVAGETVDGLAAFFRKVWSLGPAGSDVPLTIQRDEETFEFIVASSEREHFFRKPHMHS
jgi:S1-C subfamily serine protease